MAKRACLYSLEVQGLGCFAAAICCNSTSTLARWALVNFEKAKIASAKSSASANRYASGTSSLRAMSAAVSMSQSDACCSYLLIRTLPVRLPKPNASPSARCDKPCASRACFRRFAKTALDGLDCNRGMTWRNPAGS